MHLWEVICTVLLFMTLGDSNISVSPQFFIVQFDSNGHPSNNLTVVCSPPTDNAIKGITFLQLQKYQSDNNKKIVLSTVSPSGANKFELTPEIGLAHRKYDLTGQINVDDPLASFLRVEFYDGSCADEGMFQCSIHFHREGAKESEILYHSANVTTKTLPERALIFPRPFQETYFINQIVELHCSGQTGSPSAYFRWYYRHTGLGAEQESDYQALTFGVTHSEGPYPQGFCKHFRSATLWLRTELFMDGVEIRCLPVRGLEQYTNQSATFVFSVREAVCEPECRNGGVCKFDICRCTANFTGAFCEEAVKVPCGHDCDSSSASPVTRSSVSWMPVLVLLLMIFWR